MGLWQFIRKGPEAIESPKEEKNNKAYKNFLVKAIGFISSQGSGRENFLPSEYSLDEIRIASESDSYIKMSLMKYSNMIYKAGYEIKGDNEKAIEYIKTRFKVMSFSTKIPMDILWQEVGDDLIKYSNAFLIKSRVDNIMPGVKAKGVFSKKPIGGYFRVDPASVTIKRAKNGSVLKYKQGYGSDEKEFAPEDVVHFYLDKDSNNAFGTPRIIAALEDVKLLRRIEGNIISLIYRFAIPIYQWIVGLPEAGLQATDKEISEAQREIEKTPIDGVIVTNEKTKIKAIGAEGHALDASSYLLYFEKRVFTALGVSESQMGRGGSSKDSDSMEAQAHDTIKHIQRTMSIMIENFVINELLLEGGFNPILKEEDVVTYNFNEISLDTKVKVENHELLKFQSNVITFDEVRQSIGRRPCENEDRLYVNMIENESAIKQIKAKTDSALDLTKAKGSSGIGGNGQVKSAEPNKAVDNIGRPENQFGKTSVKIKESLELSEKALKEKAHKKKHKKIYKAYNDFKEDLISTDADIDTLIALTKESILSEIKLLIDMESFEGMTKASNDLKDIKSTYTLIPNINLTLRQFNEEADKDLKKIFKDLKLRVKDKEDKTYIDSIFKSLEYRIRFMIEFILPKVYWYSYIKTGAHYDIKKAYVDFNGSDDEKDHPAVINTKAFSVDEIPAYHSFCDCTVSFKAGDK